MMNRKKIIVSILTLIMIFIGIPVLIYGPKKEIKRDAQNTVIVGLTKEQGATFMQELSTAQSQYQYIKNGDKYLVNGRYDEAEKEYKTALSLAKSSGTKGEAYRCLANLYEKKRDYSKAIEYIELEIDKYVADWAKEPLVERSKYLKHAVNGKFEQVLEHAKNAIEEERKLTKVEECIDEYKNRLNDLIASKDYILSLKKSNQ